jgi:hypothetical protein
LTSDPEARTAATPESEITIELCYNRIPDYRIPPKAVAEDRPASASGLVELPLHWDIR